MTMDKQKWEEISLEIERLCVLHDDAIANYEKCREFANRLSLFMLELEDLRCYQIANMVMDALAYCSPKTASHCETAYSEKNRLERIKEEIKKKLPEVK
jgi:hypothetical protein